MASTWLKWMSIVLASSRPLLMYCNISIPFLFVVLVLQIKVPHHRPLLCPVTWNQEMCISFYLLETRILNWVIHELNVLGSKSYFWQFLQKRLSIHFCDPDPWRFPTSKLSPHDLIVQFLPGHCKLVSILLD